MIHLAVTIYLATDLSDLLTLVISIITFAKMDSFRISLVFKLTTEKLHSVFHLPSDIVEAADTSMANGHAVKINSQWFQHPCLLAGPNFNTCLLLSQKKWVDGVDFFRLMTKNSGLFYFLPCQNHLIC